MAKSDIGLLVIGALALWALFGRGQNGRAQGAPNARSQAEMIDGLENILNPPNVGPGPTLHIPPATSGPGLPNVSGTAPILTGIKGLPIPISPVPISGTLFGQLQQSLAAETATLPIHEQIAAGQEALIRFRRPPDYQAAGWEDYVKSPEYQQSVQAAQSGQYYGGVEP